LLIEPNRKDNKLYRKNKNKDSINGVIEVRNTNNGDAELLVKKFVRKVRNSGILDEYRSRRYFKSKSELRREKVAEKERIIRRVNERRSNLLKPGRQLSNRRGTPRRK
tara:strand:- start:45 stop:368 length:324 start_codon:yes stop_codon:yes gene_type:complete